MLRSCRVTGAVAKFCSGNIKQMSCGVAESTGGCLEVTRNTKRLWTSCELLRTCSALWREQWRISVTETSSRGLGELRNLPEATWRLLENEIDGERTLWTWLLEQEYLLKYFVVWRQNLAVSGDKVLINQVSLLPLFACKLCVAYYSAGYCYCIALLLVKQNVGIIERCFVRARGSTRNWVASEYDLKTSWNCN